MSDEIYGPGPRAMGVVAEFEKGSGISLSTPDAMALAYLINKEFMEDGVRIDTLKGALDTAIACGDAQREKIKNEKRCSRNMIRALGSIIHKCNTVEGPDLAVAVREIARKILEGDAYPIDKQGASDGP